MTKLKTTSAKVTNLGTRGYAEYEIDIETILRDDLPRILATMPIAPLTREAIDEIPAGAKGAYVLFLDGHPVYAGKTDARHGFRDRLNRHAFTIQNRKNLEPQRIGFKAIRIMVFSNFDVEAILIKAMRKADKSALAWNDSGFGSNDPGHNREGQAPANFDVLYPVNIDRKLSLFAPGSYGLLPFLIQLKDHLPYGFRYQTDIPPGGTRPKSYKKGHIDHHSGGVVTVDANDTVRDLLKKVLRALPAGWRVTVFPGRVILYKDDTIYKNGPDTFTA